MNDRQNAYDPYGGEYAADQYTIVGYDEYGRPVYQQVQPQPPQQSPQGYDPYAAQQQPPQAPAPQGYGYDPYGSYDPYATGGQAPAPAYDPYGGQQEQTAWIPQQHQPAPEAEQVRGGGEAGPGPGHRPAPDTRDAGEGLRGEGLRGDGPRGDGPDYRTEQFSFIEEPDENSEDVIDWLKFTESRTERREEAKRRGRSRMVALVVVLALALTGGAGYLWYAGKLPGMSEAADSGATAAGPQKRDVIVVHLHNTKKGGTSTALLVNNTTSGRGSTVLLPNSLAVTDEDGASTTLAKSVDDDGSTGTREAVDTLLGTSIEGTWRLDTPYLNNLVELVGNIDIDTDASVPAAKKGETPLVKRGENQTLSGPMAVAYATYRAPGEPETAQLNRFGQVMQGVLRKISADPKAATITVETLAQILDPSLKEKDLGAFLAKLADRAKGGDYATQLLPVQQNGRLSREATDRVVKNILGGTVKSPEKGASLRVGVEDATGAQGAANHAKADLVNGGYTFVDRGSGSSAQASSQVIYGAADKKDEAVEVAKTLGLQASAARKGKTPANVDVAVVLGGDYRTE